MRLAGFCDKESTIREKERKWAPALVGFRQISSPVGHRKKGKGIEKKRVA